jgi:hypothetical protein
VVVDVECGQDDDFRRVGRSRPEASISCSRPPPHSAAAGWASPALLERLTARARTIWTVIAVAVLMLSLLAGPAAGITSGAKAGLALLHLAVGVVVIGGLRGSNR